MVGTILSVEPDLKQVQTWTQNHKTEEIGSLRKRHKWKHSEWKELYEMLNRAKPQTTSVWLKKAKEKALKQSFSTGNEHHEKLSVEEGLR